MPSGPAPLVPRSPRKVDAVASAHPGAGPTSVMATSDFAGNRGKSKLNTIFAAGQFGLHSFGKRFTRAKAVKILFSCRFRLCPNPLMLWGFTGRKWTF